MKLKRHVKYTLFGLLAVLLTAFDQWTKIWIVNLTEGVEGRGFSVIKNVLNFTYLENHGASMGILGGQRILLIIMTIVILCVGVWYFKKHPSENCLLLTAVSLIASGAVGNLIDRVFLGYVRDFIDLQFVNFYIFNFADCAICVGAGLLILYAFLNIED